MDRIRLGKYHATGPAGEDSNPLWWRLLAPLARRSRRLRALGYGLPRSRLRTALVWRYYRDIADDINAGDVDRHLPAVDPNAEIRIVMETFRGREAKEALLDFRESFPNFGVEMREVVNPDGPHVLLFGRVMGDGSVSGVSLQENHWGLRVKIHAGMAIEIQAHQDRAEALEAVGLSE